jgi:hypothetical protein
MSGAISIPFAAAAIFIGGSHHERRWFTALAFIALWICVLRMGWKNCQLLEKHNQASDNAIKTKQIKDDLTRLHGELRIARQLIESDMIYYSQKFESIPDTNLHEVFTQIHESLMRNFDASKALLFRDDSGFPKPIIQASETKLAETTIQRLNQYLIRLAEIIKELN